MPANKRRLTKAALRAYIEREHAHIQNGFGIDPNIGTAQLDGRNQAAIIAYGRYRALENILEDFDATTR